jgi:hypothetical protein
MKRIKDSGAWSRLPLQGISESADSPTGINSIFRENDAGVGRFQDDAEAGSEPIQVKSGKNYIHLLIQRSFSINFHILYWQNRESWIFTVVENRMTQSTYSHTSYNPCILLWLAGSPGWQCTTAITGCKNGSDFCCRAVVCHAVEPFEFLSVQAQKNSKNKKI